MPFVKINDINIFYKIFVDQEEVETFNPDEPVMIVCHGGMGIIDHQLEVPAWLPFSSHLPVIFIDQRGCGRSDDGDQSLWTMDQFGDDIFNFSNALGIDHPVVAGVSSGGYASIAYATRHPSHPRALILANTEPTVSPEAKRDAYAAIGRRADRRDFAPFKDLNDNEIEEYADKAAAATIAYDLEPTPENFEAFAKYGFSLISKTSYEFIPPFRQNMEMKKLFANGYKKFDYSDSMPRITCPVLWFAGEWDPLHPACCAQEGAKKLTQVDLHILPTGAPVYQDNPDAFYQEVSIFLQKLGVECRSIPCGRLNQ